MKMEHFPARFESLEMIGKFVREAAVLAELDSMAIYAVETAVDEACSNIIEHAYNCCGEGEIEVTCKVDEKGLTMILVDHGLPFDPNCVPEPDVKAALEERETHGLGLFFMRKMMDEVRFDFSNPDHNTLILVKLKTKRA
jgi:serine/threonine-protein kinase RsbW